MCAGLTHNVSPSRLQSISRAIPKVIILTGDEDQLVATENSFYLKKHMKEAEFIQWKETGHAIHFQRTKEFNELIERLMTEGRERVKSESIVPVASTTALAK
jgi:pimeloyl-ACP methyl ester carboxylesterase